MVYEIINPSDPFTLKSDNVLASCLACLILGEGKYALRDKNGNQACPFFLFDGHDQWLTEHHQTTFEKGLHENGPAIAEVLDSVMIGDFQAREDAEDAISRMSPVDARNFLAKRHDRYRSSMNNIGKRAKSLAKILRQKVAES